MNTPFTFEEETFETEFPLTGESASGEEESWEIPSPYAQEFEGEFEGGAVAAAPPPLSPALIARAVAANRVLAVRIGWGHLEAGRLVPIPEVLAFLGLAAGATEQDVARGVARWQQTTLRQTGDGQLGAGTWAQMLRATPPVIPALQFKRAAWDVYYNGRKLGILEKTAPYLALNAGGAGGASIQLGFRVTDRDAVRRAGFVDGTGEDHFRWIQRIITNRQFVGGGIIRRHGKYIDPQSGARDTHPYYWDEPGQGDPQFRVDAFVNRQASAAVPPHHGPRPQSLALWYDLIFEDAARRPLTEASATQRVYWNAEVALVGVRPPVKGITRNVVLNTVLWGFDLVVTAGGPGVRLNKVQAGVRGGSTDFRQVLSTAIGNGMFPNHCFVGAGYSRAATCA